VALTSRRISRSGSSQRKRKIEREGGRESESERERKRKKSRESESESEREREREREREAGPRLSSHLAFCRGRHFIQPAFSPNPLEARKVRIFKTGFVESVPVSNRTLPDFRERSRNV